MKKIIITLSFLLGSINVLFAQWPNNSLLLTGNTLFGTNFNAPIEIYTFNRRIARFSNNNSLSTLTGDNGDGLRILNLTPIPSAGNLDLFTTFNNGANETHIRFGNSSRWS